VFPDEEDAWREQLGHERPAWLQMFRDFPHDPRETPPCAHGSVIVSEDGDWLSQNVDRLIGVLYFMGLHSNHWHVPSDALVHFGFKVASGDGQMVELATKSRPMIEHHDSIQLLPPLELRAVGRCFSLSLHETLNQNLSARFFTNPEDGLVVACYHLFRTQWGNFQQTPLAQDFAAYCACLEAAMQVQEKYPYNIYRGLATRFEDYPGLEQWVKGLYAERSVFNHGISDPNADSSTDDRVLALLRFRDQPGNWHVLREVCRDVIHRELEPFASDIEKQFMRSVRVADKELRQLLLSQSVWRTVSRRLSAKGAVNALQNAAGDAEESWSTLALQFNDEHDWRFVPRLESSRRLYCCLRTLGAGAGLRARSNGDTTADRIWSALYTAAEAGDDAAIRSWSIERKREGAATNMGLVFNDACLMIAGQIAEYFERWR